jgi:hypothetical protein
MTGTRIVDLSPIIFINPEDVFLIENVGEALSNSVTYANLVSSIGSSLFIANSNIAVSSATEWQSNGNTVVTSGSVNFVGAGVSVTDVGGVATISGLSAVASGVKSVINFTATAEQTVITVDYSITNVSVFISGIKLRNDSYTATNGTTIILDSAVDLDTWISIETSSNANSYADFTATNNQAIFAFAYTIGTLEVFVSGVKIRDTDYTASNGTSIILNNPVNTDTWVQAISTS